jgi:hypothetical protein
MKNSSITQNADHLDKATREFLNSCADKDLEKRIRHIEGETWIGYGMAVGIIEQIERMINRPRVTRMHSLLVIGSTDNGKTSIRRKIEVKYERFSAPEGKINFPVVSIQMPPNPDERGFYNALLRGMMHPPFMSGKVDHIRDFVISLFLELNVRLLLIDEVQHIDRMPYRRQRTLLDTIKYISNEISLPVAAFGTSEAINVFASDPQLQNRFKKMYLPKWESNDDFRRLLVSFEKLLPLKEPSGLSNQEIASRIFTKTNGTIGEVNTLIRNSAVAALNAGKEKITLDIIERIPFESSPLEPL